MIGESACVSIREMTPAQAVSTPTGDTAMTLLTTFRSADVDPRLARTLWQWLGLGALCVLLLPAARGDAHLVGWLPFWLVLAPASALAVLYRTALTAAWRARLVLATPRRRRRTGSVQAQHVRFGRPRGLPARRVA